MPYFQTTFETSLTAEEVGRRLNVITRPHRSFMAALEKFGEKDDAAFIGRIDARAFHMRRNIGYGNSFLPTIRGRVLETSGGSLITLRMHIGPLVGAFILFWLGTVGRLAFETFRNEFPNGTWMLACGILLTCGGFYPEALVAARKLRRELAAR